MPVLTDAAVRSSVAARRAQISGLVAGIGGEPELGYAEHRAVARIRALLESSGLPFEAGLGGLPTAFRSRVGEGSPRIALLAEYDALPGLGHGCGHNVIAGSAVGAFLALARHWQHGTLELIGCPAEESTVDNAGGKIRLLDAGVFDGVDAALMVHFYDRSTIITGGALAGRGVDFAFRGVAAHAALDPASGRNALDAAVAAYAAIGMLRQQLPDDVRVHGIVRDGGQTPNVVPERAALRFRIRAATRAELDGVFERVLACAQGGATAAGCELEWSDYMPVYAEMRQNPELVRIGHEVLQAVGEAPDPDAPALAFGSSDLGNVSHRVPALEIGLALAPRGVALHTEAFARAARDPAAGGRAVTGALSLALAALRVTGRADAAWQAFREPC